MKYLKLFENFRYKSEDSQFKELTDEIEQEIESIVYDDGGDYNSNISNSSIMKMIIQKIGDYFEKKLSHKFGEVIDSNSVYQIKDNKDLIIFCREKNDSICLGCKGDDYELWGGNREVDIIKIENSGGVSIQTDPWGNPYEKYDSESTSYDLDKDVLNSFLDSILEDIQNPQK